MKRHNSETILQLIRVILVITFAVKSLVDVATVGCATPKAIYELLWAIFILV